MPCRVRSHWPYTRQSPDPPKHFDPCLVGRAGEVVQLTRVFQRSCLHLNRILEFGKRSQLFSGLCPRRSPRFHLLDKWSICPIDLTWPNSAGCARAVRWRPDFPASPSVWGLIIPEGAGCKSCVGLLFEYSTLRRDFDFIKYLRIKRRGHVNVSVDPCLGGFCERDLTGLDPAVCGG